MPTAAKKTPAKTSKPADVFSSLEVALVTGVSLRQLQWWDEQGIVTPMQKGHRRLYRMREVIDVALITELRRKGISLQKTRKVLSRLQEKYGDSFYMPRKNGRDLHLLTDGDNIFLESSGRAIVSIMKESSQPITAICISDHIARLNSRSGLRKQAKRETKTAAPARMRKAS